MPLCIAEDNNLAKHFFFSLLKYISRLPAAQFTFPAVETNTLIKMGGKKKPKTKTCRKRKSLCEKNLNRLEMGKWSPLAARLHLHICKYKYLGLFCSRQRGVWWKPGFEKDLFEKRSQTAWPPPPPAPPPALVQDRWNGFRWSHLEHKKKREFSKCFGLFPSLHLSAKD